AVSAGESVGLVGESGSGKTTLARVIVGLVKQTHGSLTYRGSPYPSTNPKGFRKLRRDVQMVFQDPYSSLNPYMTVADIIGEALKIHRLAKTKRETVARVVQLLDEVGLAGTIRERHPHELSGGQRQRVSIARSLAVEPSLLV